jgi:hypothetical protein
MTSKVYVAMASVILVLAAPRGRADPVDLCAVEKQDSVRLACFDREVAARRVAAAHAQKAQEENAAPQGTEPHRPSAQGRVAVEQPTAFVARVTGLRRISARETTFELENGQAWKQMEASTWLDIQPQDLVTITPGALGSFFLTHGSQTVRVRRIR